MKVVTNDFVGGKFSISQEAKDLLRQYSKPGQVWFHRHDRNLIRVIEELGDRAQAPQALFHIHEIPREYVGSYRIIVRDGKEELDACCSYVIAEKLWVLKGSIAELSPLECQYILLQMTQWIDKEGWDPMTAEFYNLSDDS